MSACKYCGERVRWAKNEKTGRWMILDFDPSPYGNVTLQAGRNGEPPAATVHGDAKTLASASGAMQLDFDGAEHPTAFVVHQATCSNYDQQTKQARERA